MTTKDLIREADELMGYDYNSKEDDMQYIAFRLYRDIVSKGYTVSILSSSTNGLVIHSLQIREPLSPNIVEEYSNSSKYSGMLLEEFCLRCFVKFLKKIQ